MLTVRYILSGIDEVQLIPWDLLFRRIDGLKHLQAHVATTAYDSNDNVDQPKCPSKHPRGNH